MRTKIADKNFKLFTDKNLRTKLSRLVSEANLKKKFFLISKI